MKPATQAQQPAAEKTCIDCGEDWPADTEFFHREPRSNDGLTGQCKACRAAYDSGRNGTANRRKRGQLTKGLQPVFAALTIGNNMTQRIHNIQTLKSYRAYLVPLNADPENLECLANAGLLQTIRVKAANSDHAEAQAHLASGKGVLRVERVEPTNI